jgi:hypothetical protein
MPGIEARLPDLTDTREGIFHVLNFASAILPTISGASLTMASSLGRFSPRS